MTVNSYGEVNALYHWFFQSTQETEPVDWDCVWLHYFENSGSHCEVLRDSIADMMQPGGFNWASMRPQIESYRTWMHAEPVEAMFVHWDRCFPSFTQTFENLPESEKNTIDADYIRNLIPEETW